MQLFTLYNFASDTAVIRGGLQGRLGPKPPKINSFHPARPFLRLMDHRSYPLSTLEIPQYRVTFQDLQLSNGNYH